MRIDNTKTDCKTDGCQVYSSESDLCRLDKSISELKQMNSEMKDQLESLAAGQDQQSVLISEQHDMSRKHTSNETTFGLSMHFDRVTIWAIFCFALMTVIGLTILNALNGAPHHDVLITNIISLVIVGLVVVFGLKSYWHMNDKQMKRKVSG